MVKASITTMKMNAFGICPPAIVPVKNFRKNEGTDPPGNGIIVRARPLNTICEAKVASIGGILKNATDIPFKRPQLIAIRREIAIQAKIFHTFA
jgi:hypothetical protein